MTSSNASRQPITALLPAPERFWHFNREERNAVAILFGLLTSPGNLRSFASQAGWAPNDLDAAEVSVEWSYLRDLWNGHSMNGDQALLRKAILDSLQPSARDQLESGSILEFNTYFGAVPRPSALYIQSPSNWSVGRFDSTIADDCEFRRTCIFKWAFNIKPDLVVQTPSGQVLCVEAKWDSPEGVYPASEKEKAIFARRGIQPVPQTAVQKYLVEELLGFRGTFIFLTRTRQVTKVATSIIWPEVVARLDLSSSPDFIRNWCHQVMAETEHGEAPPPGP